jgi:cyanophycin synthetase
MLSDQVSAQLPDPGKLSDGGLALLEGIQSIPGYVLGFRQPSILFRVFISKRIAGSERALEARLQIADQVFASSMSVESECEDMEYGSKPIQMLLRWTRLALESHGSPVLQSARVTGTSKGDDGLEWLIFQPCAHPSAARVAVSLSMVLLKLAIKADCTAADFKAALNHLVEENKAALSTGRLRGFNTLHFIRAAHELGVPWMQVSGNIFQFGHGKNARWLESSFTDSTSVVATNLVRNKLHCGSLLRRAGFPVAEQSAANSASQAISIAKEIGYPVVVKPVDLDGGAAVSSLLTDDKQVEAAFIKAEGVGSAVLVEKFIPGRDYRVQVVNGVVHGVLERRPGQVVGNGLDTVRQLVLTQNAERKQARDDRRFLHPIEFDDEADRMLAFEGLSWGAIPEAGRTVRLRAASNVASGGVPIPIDLAEVHAENVSLVLRATRLLRLDVAGVDLILADIGRPWWTGAATICEVNAMPQMFTSMHVPMLQSVLPTTSGRVPVIVMISAPGSESPEDALHQSLRREYRNPGCVGSGGVWLGGRERKLGDLGVFDASRSLLMDPELDALLIANIDAQVMTRGWPVDHCDVLIVFCGEEGREHAGAIERMCSVAAGLNPGLVLVDEHGHSLVPIDQIFADSEIKAVHGSESRRELNEELAVSAIACLTAQHGSG